MNPTYFIFGHDRRLLKKELSELRRSLAYQPHYEDLCHVYGTELIPEVELNYINKLKERIKEIEKLLPIKQLNN